MANLRITWLGHGGILYRSPNDAWVWVDRWTGGPTYPAAYREAERVSVVGSDTATSTTSATTWSMCWSWPGPMAPRSYAATR